MPDEKVGAGAVGGEDEVPPAGVTTIPVERFNRIYGRSKELEGQLVERDKAISAVTTELEERRAEIDRMRAERVAAASAGTDDEPITRGQAAQISAQTKREIRADQAQAFLFAQPEAKTDEKFKDNIKGIIKEYDLIRLDPINAAEVAMNLYRAATKKGTDDENPDNGNGGRTVDKRAVGSLRGGRGGGNKGSAFSPADIANMSIEDYKKNREKILSAANAGEVI